MITLPLLMYSCLKNLCKCLHCGPHDNPFLKGFWFPARFQISHEETEGIVLVFFKKFLSGSGRLSHQPPDITNMRPKHCPNRICWALEFPGKTAVREGDSRQGPPLASRGHQPCRCVPLDTWWPCREVPAPATLQQAGAQVASWLILMSPGWKLPSLMAPVSGVGALSHGSILPGH